MELANNGEISFYFIFFYLARIWQERKVHQKYIQVLWEWMDAKEKVELVPGLSIILHLGKGRYSQGPVLTTELLPRVMLPWRMPAGWEEEITGLGLMQSSATGEQNHGT